MVLQFEFDAEKSLINEQKHGIDFTKAQELWQDSDRIEIPARTEDEPRYLIIGKIEDRMWSAIITYRQDRVRIISCRCSRDSEIKFYES
jgi:hypothetical protein